CRAGPRCWAVRPPAGCTSARCRPWSRWSPARRSSRWCCCWSACTGLGQA
ncbi:MAG: hypothetical protein AVDCRST_MAG48-168, partial [uncultured Friedmanniella sp.]